MKSGLARSGGSLKAVAPPAPFNLDWAALPTRSSKKTVPPQGGSASPIESRFDRN